MTSASAKTGATSQVSASGSKIGGEQSENSQITQRSLYGNVKPPKMSEESLPKPNKNLEHLERKLKGSLRCGVGCLVVGVILASGLIFLAFLAFRGNVIFPDIPDMKEFMTVHKG
ncbi:hypothetical protein GCK72_015226 [Caenorhabditis remanei]|uniref:Uncharacterized protein n=1 Tax=Caenorhabditis remanei TaxID=31234 RepID=A0A6A5GVY1_CAERE|nr:hypothetical protein GCK72_015226 [Caenorhabditis remanei]KAF1758766.1 hypothetical protein GCK72_015226 [Caenorhabditis remanei]